MSIIFERREDVINNNNSAQDEIENIISRLNPSTKQLMFSIPLHGDIDFEILNKLGFRNVETICFEEPGEITSIKNLPKSLHVLKCENQLLVELFELNDSLKELHCDYNYIQEFSGEHAKNLVKLHISHNRLEKLDGLGPHLEELYCTNNKLQLLNLEKLNNLKVLHVSENPTLVIEHVPASLGDFKSDNSPFAVVKYDALNEPGAETAIGKMNHIHHEQKIDYLGALDVYFKLKKNYDDAFFTAKKKAFLSAKTKLARKKLVALIQPKCINCKRPGGTIFEHKDNKYTAICGVREVHNKCNLNIQLYRGYFADEESMLYMFKKEVDKVKEKIVRQKLDTLFDYVNEKVAAERFKKEIEYYHLESSIYNEILQRHNETYYSKTQEDAVNEKITEINGLLSQYNAIINDYKNNSENKELLSDALHLHISTIDPEIENLRRLKNGLNEVIVDVNVVGHTYDIQSTLVQRKATLANMDMTLEEPPRVVKFTKKD